MERVIKTAPCHVFEVRYPRELKLSELSAYTIATVQLQTTQSGVIPRCNGEKNIYKRNIKATDACGNTCNKNLFGEHSITDIKTFLLLRSVAVICHTDARNNEKS